MATGMVSLAPINIEKAPLKDVSDRCYYLYIAQKLQQQFKGGD